MHYLIKAKSRNWLYFVKGAVKAHLFINDFILTQLIGKDINEIWKITNPINLLVEELNKKGLKSQPKTR